MMIAAVQSLKIQHFTGKLEYRYTSINGIPIHQNERYNGGNPNDNCRRTKYDKLGVYR